MIINIAGGTGPMGRVHKPLFEAAGHEVIISGRNTTPTLEEAARTSDMTIVSVPIPNTEEMIARLGPYCNAMVDFTGLKVFPLQAMMKHVRPGVEIGGLHPLYGEVQSTAGETLIYCPTNRSGEKCEQIIAAFEKSGVKVKVMTPEEHDFGPSGLGQNLRTILLQAFGVFLIKSGISAKELYEMSPPPTRILIDLLARQVDEKNDQLYKDMRDYNLSTPKIRGLLVAHLENDERDLPRKIRTAYGKDFLRECQSRAMDLVRISKL